MVVLEYRTWATGGEPVVDARPGILGVDPGAVAPPPDYKTPELATESRWAEVANTAAEQI